MKVLNIKEIIRKDMPIYYRMYYSGIAALELPGGNVERRIDFSVETKPTGVREISVTPAEPIDYPLAPLNRELKQYIGALAANGALPA